MIDERTDILQGGSYLNRPAWMDVAPREHERERIKRVIAAIPADDLLGVMATAIYPESLTTCLVCRLVSPEAAYSGSSEGEHPYERLAKQYGMSVQDAEFLFGAANWAMVEVEEAIADRLNEIVEV